MRDLKVDKEICDKATPGPWKPFRDTWEPAIYTKLEDGCRGVCITRLDGLHGDQQRSDANFIAAAREGWPEAIERAIAAEELVVLLQNELVRSTAQDEEWYCEFGELREVCDEQRDSIQSLSVQVVGLQKAWEAIQDLTINYDEKVRKLINGPMACNREQAEYMIDKALSEWKKKFTEPDYDPGAEIRERISKLEAVVESLFNYRKFASVYCDQQENAAWRKVENALAALEGGR